MQIGAIDGLPNGQNYRTFNWENSGFNFIVEYGIITIAFRRDETNPNISPNDATGYYIIE